MPKPSLLAMVLAVAQALLARPALAGDVLDIPQPQIFIEAKFVETSHDELRDFGVRVGYYAAEPRPGDPFGPPTAIEAMGERGGSFEPGPTYDANTSLDGIWLGNLPGFELPLSVLEKSGDARILAAPKVLVADNETAEIFVGGELPAFPTEGGDGFAGASEFGLRLEVRPTVTADDRIQMEIVPNIDRLTLPNTGVPFIETRIIRTTVRIPDEGTLLLGGFFRHVDRDTATRVPVLGDIPILGLLFRNRTYQENRTELLVMITPVIVREDDEGGGTSSSSTSGGRKAATGTRPGSDQQRVHRPQVDPHLNQVPNVQKPGYPSGAPGYQGK